MFHHPCGGGNSGGPRQYAGGPRPFTVSAPLPRSPPRSYGIISGSDGVIADGSGEVARVFIAMIDKVLLPGTRPTCHQRNPATKECGPAPCMAAGHR